jgi:hypothetical protein
MAKQKYHKCKICGRPIYDLKSLIYGMGAVCRDKQHSNKDNQLLIKFETEKKD